MIHRAIDGHSIIKTLIEEVASLRAINKDTDVRFAVLQAVVKDKEHITKCILWTLISFKKEGRYASIHD